MPTPHGQIRVVLFGAYLVEQLVEHFLDPFHTARPRRDVRVLGVLGQNGAGQVDDADVDAGGAEFGGDDHTRMRAEFQLARSTAPAGWAERTFLQQPTCHELVDTLGDDCASEP